MILFLPNHYRDIEPFYLNYLQAFCHSDRGKKSYPSGGCPGGQFFGVYDVIIKKRKEKRKGKRKEKRRERRERGRKEERGGRFRRGKS